MQVRSICNWLCVLFVIPACVTEGNRSDSATVAQPQKKTVELRLIGTMKLAANYKAPFHLTGLTAAANRYFAVSQSQTEAAIFELAYRNQVFQVKSRYKIEGSQHLEGLDFCDGVFYFVNGATNTLRKFTVKTKKVAEIALDHAAYGLDPKQWGQNAGYQAVALDCVRKNAYLTKVRDPRLVVRADLAKGEIVETVNFPETDANDYAEAKFDQSSLYLLESQGSVITKVDIETKRTLQKVSFKSTFEDTLKEKFGAQVAEHEKALLLLKDEIWIGLDHTPVILRFKRPSGF